MSLYVLVLDVECSSLDPAKSEILEMAVEEYQVEPAGQDALDPLPWKMSQRFRPEHPEWMDPRATAVHGLTAEVLAEYETFSENMRSGYAMHLVEGLRSAKVLIGYNVDFDLRMIDAQLALVGAPSWDRTGVQVVDVMKLWTALERRTLSHAVRRFLGREHEGAHGAPADVSATATVLDALLSTFSVCDPMRPDWGLLLDAMEPRRRYYVGSRHLQWKDGQVVVAFGKMEGLSVHAVDSGWFGWFVSKDFPEEAKEVVRQLLEDRRSYQTPEAAFNTWVRARYPEPVD